MALKATTLGNGDKDDRVRHVLVLGPDCPHHRVDEISDRQAPPLAVEFTYRNIEVNRGYTDADFDPSNPNYAFGRSAAAVRATGR